MMNSTKKEKRNAWGSEEKGGLGRTEKNHLIDELRIAPLLPEFRKSKSAS